MHDPGEVLRLVVLEAERHPEAVAQRRRQEARARSRADHRERREVEGQRPRGRPLADDDVEPEVLESRIEDLLHRAAQAMDLVDEEDVPLPERGQDRGDVALALERRPGRGAQADTELLPHDVGEARLAETRRTDQEDVVERLAARTGGFERDRELLLDPLLADELVELSRPQRAVELVLVRLDRGSEKLGVCHAASRRARRTCSSTERSGSTAARACSASTTE